MSDSDSDIESLRPKQSDRDISKPVKKSHPRSSDTKVPNLKKTTPQPPKPVSTTSVPTQDTLVNLKKSYPRSSDTKVPNLKTKTPQPPKPVSTTSVPTQATLLNLKKAEGNLRKALDAYYDAKSKRHAFLKSVGHFNPTLVSNSHKPKLGSKSLTGDISRGGLQGIMDDVTKLLPSFHSPTFLQSASGSNSESSPSIMHPAENLKMASGSSRSSPMINPQTKPANFLQMASGSSSSSISPIIRGRSAYDIPIPKKIVRSSDSPN